MSSPTKGRRAAILLAFLIAAGMAILAIPWFLIPPAYLHLSLRDAVFGSDLSKLNVTVTDETTGKMITTAISRAGGAFVAPIGRINSGKGAYRAQVTGYRPAVARIDAAPLQNLHAPVELQPTFGRLEITPVNATRRDEPVAATIKEADHVMTPEPQRTLVIDLPPGSHRLTAAATGFCPSDRDYEVQAGKVTKAVLPLSPGLKDDEIARFVLGWRNEPRDLDSHFMAAQIMWRKHREHLWWGQKIASLANGDPFARLDVDELYPGRYETVTVRTNASGDYRYSIHRYAGFGTIADADAMVQVYTRGCHVQTFVPPPGCTQNVWHVASLRNDRGTVAVTDLHDCEAVPERPHPKD